MSYLPLYIHQMSIGPVPIEGARSTNMVSSSDPQRWNPERSRRVTVKEKVDQEKKVITEDSEKGADMASGIVKFLVYVVDETRESVAVATILTMVRKLDQN